MSTLVTLPPNSFAIATQYGNVPADQYNRYLSPSDIDQMLLDIEAHVPPKVSISEFIARWNLRKFVMKDFGDESVQLLLNAAVTTDNVELVSFVYNHLSYDSKFYSLELVEMPSVKSANMRDYLVDHTFNFEDDYDEELEKLRGQLKALTF